MAKILKFRKKEKPKPPEKEPVYVSVKACFKEMQKHGEHLSPREYQDFVMLLLADIIVFVIKTGWYVDAPAAIKRGIDALAARYK